ncbi:hypothetical protein [Streptomyces sp. NPDC001070]
MTDSHTATHRLDGAGVTVREAGEGVRASGGSGGLPACPVPRRGAGLQLLGEYQGSGFTEPRYLVRRADGQVVQLSRLLYLVASAIDGVRDIEDVSHAVTGRLGRQVSADNVRYLIERKLQPLGLTVPFGQDNDQVTGPRSDLLLVLKGHRVVFPARRVARIAEALAWLHRPPVVAAVLSAAVVMEAWLFAVHGAMAPVLRVLEQPVLMLAVFALTVGSLVFHEFGHASACRYGGARPGDIGCGLFLIWPSMYTDVTDVYRIGRAGRMRTDLGGIYFNVVFMLVLTTGYVLTGQSFFLGAVYLAHFEVIEQLMPAVRLDGYYILGDLAGIPDLYGKIRPILLSMLPGRPVAAEVADLKRSARVIVTVWVLTMVPLLLGELGYALWNLPRLVATGLRSLSEQLTGTWEAFTDGRFAAGAMGVVGSLMLIVPLAGAAYLSVRIGGRLVRATLRATEGRTRLRGVICAGVLVGAAAVCGAWFTGVAPRPLPPRPPITPILQPGVPTIRPVDPALRQPSADEAVPEYPAGGPPAVSRPAATPQPGVSQAPATASPPGPSATRTSASPSGTGRPAPHNGGPAASARPSPSTETPSATSSATPSTPPSPPAFPAPSEPPTTPPSTPSASSTPPTPAPPSPPDSPAPSTPSAPESPSPPGTPSATGAPTAALPPAGPRTGSEPAPPRRDP